mmetsp:Transcript_4576/g.5671  ORF Transcript_4576/g.5671 Transcript_4576/m.5671 type:complete len:80 (+) Transcript_4576:163-402(+)
MSRVAIFVIALTIGIGYTIIVLFSSPGLAKALDPELVGVGIRSVFNLEAFTLLLGSCSIVAFLEYLFFYLRIIRHIWWS